MNKWTEHQLKEVLALYCQIPFGRLHGKNPDIIRLAQKIGRTPSAVAMKMCNMASLDPAIQLSGRKGLNKASALDKKVWDEFENDWDAEMEAATLVSESVSTDVSTQSADTTKTVSVEIRTKQQLFRKMILANYNTSCCISGLEEPRLLIASHIMPWSVSQKNRLNPQNGLCLSALHDKAFDIGLLTVLPDYTIAISKILKGKHSNLFAKLSLLDFASKKINLPEKFYPDKKFLAWHNDNIFIQ